MGLEIFVGSRIKFIIMGTQVGFTICSAHETLHFASVNTISLNCSRLSPFHNSLPSYPLREYTLQGKFIHAVFLLLLLSPPGVNKKPLTRLFHVRQFHNPEGLDSFKIFYMRYTVSEFFTVVDSFVTNLICNVQAFCTETDVKRNIFTCAKKVQQ